MAISGLAAGEATPRVVLSFGMGADSASLLLRWLREPSSRNFDLDELVVITAQTGDEKAISARDNEAAILPLLRANNVRFIQVARSGRYVTKDGSGVVVLSDTRRPDRIHVEGLYKLSDEMLGAGTVPQVGGARLCSVHSKGDVLDLVIAEVTRGQAFRHVVGFEANELARVRRDRAYNTHLRTGEYPLAEWSWDRAACEDYLLRHTGIQWTKSACTFCPFALSSKAGRARTLNYYATNVDDAVDALFMEHVALGLNSNQGLLGKARLIDLVRDAGHHHLVDALEQRLDATEHALYDVRRIFRPNRNDPKKVANAARSVRRLAAGSRADLVAALNRREGLVEQDDAHTRLHLQRRGRTLPAMERFLTVAPAVVHDKQSTNFEEWWTDVRSVA